MNIISKIVTALLVLLMFSSGVRAQFLWEVEKSDNDWRYQNTFQALNCSGDICIAAGAVFDYLDLTFSMMFWRSTDGGNSWRMQDPHFSYYHDEAQNLFNVFTQVQQIDSLSAVAIGKYGVMFRTSDGGDTWKKQDCGTESDLVSVHFSDPLTGIFSSQSSANQIPSSQIFTTSDGGTHWVSLKSLLDPLTFADISIGNTVSQSHSFGNGKFSILKSGLGPIWTTSDNWKTTQDSHLLIDSTTDSAWQSYSFSGCRFRGIDTVIAYGSYDSVVFLSAIVRSTDGGLHWGKPFRSSIVGSSWSGAVNDMTEINNDTTLAITYDLPAIIKSTDAGKTWNTDPIRLDTANFNVTGGFGLNCTKNGPIAIVGSGYNFIIVKGRLSKSSVKSEISDNGGSNLFPNPARTEVHVHTNSSVNIISIFDMLGREIRRKKTSVGSDITFDLRGLSSGVYIIISESHQLIGKLIISDE
jgi:photosystem II stability/assembly factor-like uncharacterized protein